MVSSAAEAALHPKPEGGVDARHAAEVESMSHSLSASRNVMAALAPLASPADFGDGAAALNGEHAAGKTSSGLQKSVLGSADVGVQFRLYKNGSADQPLQRVGLSQDALEKAFSAENEGVWERVLTPAKSVLEKDLVLASLLEQPLTGPADDSACPAEQADLIPQLSGVLMMQPLARTATNVAYGLATSGEAASEAFRVFMHKDGEPVSAWHDVPLHNPEDGSVNFICEIPKNSSAKMEVATGEEGTPIKQDIKKGKLRFYHEAIPWNYGMLPQTWEDPDHMNNDCGGVKGDNDPVDVVEIGCRTLKMGGVYRVKPLGAYAMIDEGELDWKVIAIRVDDPLAPLLNDVADIDRELPGELERIMTWFRDYKIPDGKAANSYGFGAKALDAAFARGVVAETSAFYQRLRAGTCQAAVAMA